MHVYAPQPFHACFNYSLRNITVRSDYMEDDHEITHASNAPTTPNPETSCLKSIATSGRGGGGGACSNINKEQDRFLPIANVGRIMKKVIPGNGKISKDAKETVQECVSEFISFVTGEASDKCQREKRKTINGEDIIWAITTLGFEDYVSPLKQYLSKYREIEGEKVNIPKLHRSEQRLQQQEQEPNLGYPSSVYSSTTLISQPPFVAADQPFPSPFSPDSIQKQLHQQEHFDSGGRW